MSKNMFIIQQQHQAGFHLQHNKL